MESSATDKTARVSPHQGLLQKFFWVAGSGLVRQLAFFVVNIFLAYRLSKESFGTLAFAFGCLMVLVGVADFGLRQVGWREIARRPQHIAAIVGKVFSARLLTTAIAMTAYLGVAAWYCRTGQEWTIFLAYSLGLLFNTTLFDFPFLGQDQMCSLGRAYAIAYSYYVTACLLSVRGDETAWLVPVHFVVAHAILFAALYTQYRREHGPLILSFRRRTLRKLYRESWPLGANFVVFRLITNYPVLLLGLLLSSMAVAEYRVAELFYALFASLGLYLGSSSYSTFASSEGRQDGRVAEGIERALRTILLIHVPIAFLMITALPIALDVFLPGGTDQAGPICLLLGISLPLGVANRYLRTCLPSVGLNRELLAVNLACLLAGIGAGTALIPLMGVPGIAAGVLLVDVGGFAMLLVSLNWKLPTIELRRLVCLTVIVLTSLPFSHSLAMAWRLSPRLGVTLCVLACMAAMGWALRRRQATFHMSLNPGAGRE